MIDSHDEISVSIAHEAQIDNAQEMSATDVGRRSFASKLPRSSALTLAFLAAFGGVACSVAGSTEAASSEREVPFVRASSEPPPLAVL